VLGEVIVKSRTVEVAILSDGGMCAIPVPFDPKVVFGKVRAPVKVTVNGYTLRSTIARMGGQTFIRLRKRNRDAAAVEGGDRVKVRIAADAGARVVEVPADLAKALKAKPILWTRWGALSYTHQRECVESVLSAKKQETRERRIEKVVNLVASKAVKGRLSSGLQSDAGKQLGSAQSLTGDRISLHCGQRGTEA